eukprot:scaffold13663_cov78-Skeletonema_dohrnii-CCMP3373.AAC.4
MRPLGALHVKLALNTLKASSHRGSSNVANKPSRSDEDDARDEDLGHFMYKGLPYLKTMKDQEHEWMTRKEKGEKERQRKRQEERATSSGSAFGSTYSKLPGKKWNPSSDRPRSASNMRPGSRGLRPGDVNRVNRPGGERATKPGMTNKSSGYGARAASAPRMRHLGEVESKPRVEECEGKNDGT